MTKPNYKKTASTCLTKCSVEAEVAADAADEKEFAANAVRREAQAAAKAAAEAEGLGVAASDDADD
jgi:large subunit ribosomal protein L9